MAALQSPQPVFVTRVINPCVLIEIGDVKILTDPFFAGHRMFPMHEPIGVSPDRLPQLQAVLGGHGVIDHWQPRSMASYRFHEQTDVFTATKRMARQAKRAGFEAAEQLQWGERRQLTDDVSLTCLEGEKVLAGTARTNNYLIEAPDIAIFVGTEACSLEPIERFANERAVDVAILPIDGLTFGRKQLVMDASAAVEAAKTMGARVIAPIHYSQKPVPGILRCPSGIDELERLIMAEPGITAAHGPTGKRVPIVRGTEPVPR